MIADPSCKKCTPAHARSCGGPFHISSIVAVICQPEGSAFFLKDTLLGSLHCPSLAHRHTSSECNLRRPFAAAAPGITTAPQWDESQARATSRQPNARCSQTETSFKSPANLHYLLKVHIFFLFFFFFFCFPACRLGLLEKVVEVLWNGVGREKLWQVVDKGQSEAGSSPARLPSKAHDGTLQQHRSESL